MEHNLSRREDAQTSAFHHTASWLDKFSSTASPIGRTQDGREQTGAQFSCLPDHPHSANGSVAASRGLIAGLDLIGRVGFLLNRARRVVDMTGTAHTILGGDIVLSHTFLRGARRVADEALQALLTRVACGHTGSSLEMVAIAPSLGRPLIVQAVSLPAHVFGEAAMLVTVHQTETRSDQRIDALAIACELTAAERKLTRLLAGGCGLTRAAASLGVSVSTARTHLKAIFAKTNTHSQAELAALFAGV